MRRLQNGENKKMTLTRCGDNFEPPRLWMRAELKTMFLSVEEVVENKE